MSAFPFHVDWVRHDGSMGHEAFEHKNEAIQFALGKLEEPGVDAVSTVYVDAPGRGSFIPAGCFDRQ